MLTAIAGGWFLSIGVRMIYPVLLPYLRESFGLSLAMGGLLLTALSVAYALGQLPGGVLADRLGEGTILALSTLVSAGTVTLVVVAESTPVLFAATVLFGFGTGLYGVARFTALGDIYDEQVGTATGVTLAAGDGGQSLLPPAAGFLAVALTWQVGFGFTVPAFLLAAAVLWLTVPGRTSGPTSAVDELSLDSVRYVLAGLRQPRIVRGATAILLGNCIWQAFTSFYPTYLIEVKALEPTVAGGLFGLFFALGIVIKPLAGAGYDRFGARRSLALLVLVSGIAFGALPAVHGFWPLVQLTALASFLLGYGTILLSYLTASLPTNMRGTGLGAIRTTYWTIGSVSPALFGLAADRGFFDEAFLALSVLAGLMIVLALRLPELEPV